MNNWQPIETAPKDGTEILLLESLMADDYGDVDIGAWGFIEKSDFDDSDIYGWRTYQGFMEEPTHWMPLPPKPTAGTTT